MAITKILHIKAKSNLFATIACVMSPKKQNGKNGRMAGGSYAWTRCI